MKRSLFIAGTAVLLATVTASVSSPAVFADPVSELISSEAAADSPAVGAVARSLLDNVTIERMDTQSNNLFRHCTETPKDSPNTRDFVCEHVNFTIKDPGVRLALPSVARPAAFVVNVAPSRAGATISATAHAPGSDNVFWRQNNAPSVGAFDCALHDARAAGYQGCELDVRNPNLLAATDVRVSVTYFPDNDTCPASATSSVTTGTPNDRTLRAESNSGVGGGNLTQVGDWNDDFEGPYGFLQACTRLTELNSPLLLRVESTREYYVLRPGVDGRLHLPPDPINPDNPQYRVARRYFFGPILRYNATTPASTPRFYEDPSNTRAQFLLNPGDGLWIDRYTHLQKGVVASATDSIDSASNATWSSSCPETNTCVLGIAGPPDTDSGIPLTVQPIGIADHPDTTITAPNTPIKNLVVLAPTDPHLKSVTVTTHPDNNYDKRITHTIEPGHIFVVPDDHHLDNITNNTK